LIKKQTNSVKVMTVHAAKGLEFDYVFITGLEENLFPHKRMGESQNEQNEEEERRLFYVAITRARKKLFLCYASIRTIFGSKQMNVPSEFLSDIDEELVEQEAWQDGENRAFKTIHF
jgi:DNA helicase II / ATP-dependent DNA helicase PcrA